MVVVACPLEGCEFKTQDVEPAVVAVLLQIHATSHTANGGAAKGPNLVRPRIDMGADEEAWNTFILRWNNFRIGPNIGDSTAPVQLLQCAGDDLSEMLLKADPRISTRPIDDVLAAMKSLAVIPVAKGIVRAELMQMQQANDESFRAFAAKVRGKAETCGFSLTATCPCPCAKSFPIDYTVEVIRDVLLAGIGSVDIKQEVLSADGIHGKSINELVEYVEKREMARSAMMRRPSASVTYLQKSALPTAVGDAQLAATSEHGGLVAASQSTFKRQRAPHDQTPPRERSSVCPGCGERFQPFRKLRNGWNKKPFKECLSCWRAAKRPVRGSVKLQNAECAISQAAPSVLRVSASSGDGLFKPSSGNDYLS